MPVTRAWSESARIRRRPNQKTALYQDPSVEPHRDDGSVRFRGPFDGWQLLQSANPFIPCTEAILAKKGDQGHSDHDVVASPCFVAALNQSNQFCHQTFIEVLKGHIHRLNSAIALPNGTQLGIDDQVFVLKEMCLTNLSCSLPLIIFTRPHKQTIERDS